MANSERSHRDLLQREGSVTKPEPGEQTSYLEEKSF